MLTCRASNSRPYPLVDIEFIQSNNEQAVTVQPTSHTAHETSQHTAASGVPSLLVGRSERANVRLHLFACFAVCKCACVNRCPPLSCVMLDIGLCKHLGQVRISSTFASSDLLHLPCLVGGALQLLLRGASHHHGRCSSRARSICECVTQTALPHSS